MNEKVQTPLWQWICLLVATTGRSDLLAFKLRQLLVWILRSQKKVKPGSWAGTVGTAIALLVLLYFDWNIWTVLAGALFTFVVGLCTIGWAAKWLYSRYGVCARHDGTQTDFDYNAINVDEVHGMFVSAIPSFMAVEFLRPTWGIAAERFLTFDLLVAFLLFRVFDAWKPWLIKKLEKMYDGTAEGVMIDDTAAGVAACLCSTVYICITVPIRAWMVMH